MHIYLMYIICKLITVTIHYRPPTHYLNQPKYWWPLESSSGFSHLWPSLFHNPLPTNKLHNREGRRKKNKQHGLGLAPSARGERSETLSWHTVLLWANASVYSNEISSKPQRNVTHLLTLAHPASQSTDTSSCLSVDCSVLFCWLVCSRLPTGLFCPLDWLLLFSSLLLTVSGAFLPSSAFGLLGDLARKLFVWVSRQYRQSNPLTGTHTHRNECHPSCHISL